MSEKKPHTIKSLKKDEWHTVSVSVASAVGKGTSNKELTIRTSFNKSGESVVRFWITNDEIETFYGDFESAVVKYNQLP
jgi:hypothetical protein